jgi:hypothetical protein
MSVKMNTIDNWWMDSSDEESHSVSIKAGKKVNRGVIKEAIVVKPISARQQRKQETKEKLSRKIQEINEKNEKVLRDLITEREKKIIENERFNRYYKNDIVDKVNGIIISAVEDKKVIETKSASKEDKSDEEDSDEESDDSYDEEFKNIVSITKNSKLLDVSITENESKPLISKIKVSKKTIAEVRQENKEKLYDILRELEIKEMEEERERVRSEREERDEKARIESERIERENAEEGGENAEKKTEYEKPVSNGSSKIDMKAHFYKTNPCKFASKCTRKECYGYHSEKDRRLPRCLYNLECRNENCTFIHDGEEEEWLARNPIQVEQTVTSKETVKQVKKPVVDMKAHFYKTNPCKFGSKCTRKECSGFHSEKDRRLPRCLYNLECKNINCEFVHDGQEKEWLSRNPIQKC